MESRFQSQRSIADSGELNQIRLFLEEICSDLSRFYHVEADNVSADAVRVHREFHMGIPGSYADLRIDVPERQSYFVEIVYGYSFERILATLQRKYSRLTPGIVGAERVIIVARNSDLDAVDAESQLRTSLDPALALEIWTEPELRQRVKKTFGVTINSVSETELIDVRDAIDQAKWRYSFRGEYEGHLLAGTLLWHFSTWRLRQIAELQGRRPEGVLRPGVYRDVVVLMADMCSFSSYVRDTRDDELIRNTLTGFYSKARYEVLNYGGMMYQFVGDEIIGIFGLPESEDNHIEHALECAHALLDIGNSVSDGWQRSLDRIQKTGGVHVGIAIGDLNLMPLRPFSRRHISFIGDSINLTARLMNASGPSEITVSNGYFQRLSPKMASGFEELPPVEAKNMGNIRAWKHPATLIGRRTNQMNTGIKRG